MSLCVGIQHGDGYIVAVDGRASIVYNKVGYCTDKHTKKYVIHNGKFCVTFGECTAVDKFQNLCADNYNDNIKAIFDNTITEKRKSYYLESLTRGEYDGMLLAVFEIDVAEKKIHEVNYGGEGYDEIRVDMPNFFTFGARSDEAAGMIYKECQMLENYKDVLSVQDLYAILPIGKNSIYRLLNSNTIKNIRVGNKIIIPKQNLIDFLQTTD